MSGLIWLDIQLLLLGRNLCRAAADEIIWHAKHYTGRGVMKFYPSGEDLAKDMGVSLQTLVDTHQKHFEAAKKQDWGDWDNTWMIWMVCKQATYQPYILARLYCFCVLTPRSQSFFQSIADGKMMHPLLPRLELHGKEKDPDGGPFPAYPSGKTWDEPSGKTGSGKKFFHNIIDGSKVRRFTGHRLKAVKIWYCCWRESIM